MTVAIKIVESFLEIFGGSVLMLLQTELDTLVRTLVALRPQNRQRRRLEHDLTFTIDD